MAYSALTAGEITEGEATKIQIFTKTRDNFQSHEDRLFDLEKGLLSATAYTSSATSTQSLTYVAIATLNISITTIGRGVLLMLDTSSDITGLKSHGIESVTATAAPRGLVRLQRGTTDLCYFDYRITQAAAVAARTVIPASCMKFIDHPTSGTYTYSWAYRTTDATNFKIWLQFTKATAVLL